VILGYEFLLRRELQSTPNVIVSKAITGIEASANRLKRISDRIFKMLSTEATNITLDLEKIEATELIEMVRKQVDPFVSKRAQHIIFEVAPSLEFVKVDHEKMTDVLVNLVMNAIKFSRDGQAISVSFATGENPSHFEIIVKDQGIGISEEDIAQVFAPFFSTFQSQYHSSGEFEFGKRGIGLGLSVSKRFVEMHGGFITVKSSPDHGAEFRITLPRSPEAFDSAQPVAATRH
jgi:signal transduction histidine kinase